MYLETCHDHQADRGECKALRREPYVVASPVSRASEVLLRIGYCILDIRQRKLLHYRPCDVYRSTPNRSHREHRACANLTEAVEHCTDQSNWPIFASRRCNIYVALQSAQSMAQYLDWFPLCSYPIYMGVISLVEECREAINIQELIGSLRTIINVKSLYESMIDTYLNHPQGIIVVFSGKSNWPYGA